MKVLLDPGHGGKDPGAVSANGLREADIALAVSNKLFAILQAMGVAVSATRVGDVYPTLAGRCALERQLAPDCFISLHCNAAVNITARGVEVWTSPGETAADPLATEIFQALRRSFSCLLFRADYSDGDPDKEAPFYVLRNTKSPAVLVEMGFISNADDARWLSDEWNQNRMALAIADALLLWGRNESR